MKKKRDLYGEVNPIDAALTWLGDKNAVPYFKYALSSLVPVRRPGLGTLATDMHMRLYYDEEWCRTKTVQQIATVLVHELWHNLNKHGIRGKDKPKGVMITPSGGTFSIWNVACDEAINSMMKEEIESRWTPSGAMTAGQPWQFPEGCVFPETFDHEDGLLEEEYFNRLMENATKVAVPMPGDPDKDDDLEQQPGGRASAGGRSRTPRNATDERAVEGDSTSSNSEGEPEQEDEGDEGEGESEDEEEEGAEAGKGSGADEDGDAEGDDGSKGSGGEDEQDEEGEGDSEDAGGDADDDKNEEGPPPAVMMGGCGSAATGQPASWEDPYEPENEDLPEGMDEAESDAMIREVAREVQGASLSRGDLPGFIKRWAEEKLHSEIPWEQQLRSEARRAFQAASGMTDYTYQRRNRRQGMLDPALILPGMYHPEVNAAMVVDTSGSMSQQYLEQGIAEVGRVAKACGAKGVTVLAVDAAVHTVKKVMQGREGSVELIGRGGTDMRVGIDAATELRPRPDVVIVFTDGATPWPETKPKNVRLIVVLIGPAQYVGEGGYYRGTVPAWVKRVVTVDTDKVRARR